MAPLTTRAASLVAVLALSGLAAGVSCRPGGAPPEAPEATPTPFPDTTAAGEEDCLIGGANPAAADTVTVIVETVGDSARLDAARRADPLVRIDCEGQLRSGLATEWSADSSGRVLTFVLGTPPPSAAEVVDAWRSPPAARLLRASGVVAIVPIDGQRLTVEHADPADAVPAHFSDPALAVPGDEQRPVLVVRTAGGRDLRDAFDAGADLILTADPSLLEYAEARTDITVTPMPWSVTYALVQPPLGSAPAPASLVPADSAAFRDALARDAVSTDARGAAVPYPWAESRAGCGVTVSGTARPRAAAEIVYPRSDRVARELAERIVGLHRGATAARGLADDEFATALGSGAGLGYVVAIPRRWTPGCPEGLAWPAGSKLTALIDTRLRAVARRTMPPLAVDGDGTLHAPDTDPAGP